MISRRSPSVIIVLLLILITTLGGVIYASYQISSRDIGGGYFWIQWIAARGMVVDGISPYNNTIQDRISDQVGNLLTWAPESVPKYVSPLFSSIISLPFGLIQDPIVAHTVWLTLQYTVLLFTLLIYTHLINWKPSWWLLSTFSLMILFSYRVAVNWFEGSMIIWVFSLIVLCLIALQGKRFELAGFLLALTLIQPQVTVLWVVFVLVWAASNRYWRLIFWFFNSLSLLSVLALFLDSNWFIQYLRLLWNFGDNFSSVTPANVFQQWWPGLGIQLGRVLTGLFSLILIIEWWLARHRDFPWFLWTSCLTLVISPLIGIPTNQEAHILLTLPLLTIIKNFDERWRKGGKWVILIGVGLVSVWEWYLIYSTRGNTEFTSRLLVMLPMPLLLLLGLFWIRWWAIRPKKFLFDEFRASESN